MPIAGNRSADRARAHLRWAERYSKYGDVHKATSHFGRAMEYSGFGTETVQGTVGPVDKLHDRQSELRIELSESAGKITVHVSDSNNTRNVTGAELVVAALGDSDPQEYADVIGLDNSDQDELYRTQLNKDLMLLGTRVYKHTDRRVVFVDHMYLSDVIRYTPPGLAMKLTYAAVAFLLQRGLITDDMLVVINKRGVRYRTTRYPDSLDRLPNMQHFERLGEGLLIARAGDLPKPQITVER